MKKIIFELDKFNFIIVISKVFETIELNLSLKNELLIYVYSATCNICENETYESCEKSCPADIQFYPSNNKHFEATNILISGLDQFSYYKIKVSIFFSKI